MKRKNREQYWRYQHWPDLDQRKWLAALHEGDGLTSPGPLSRLMPRTVENAELAWGRYTEFQKNRGTFEDGCDIGKRIDKEDILAFARHLLEEVEISTVLCILSSLSRAVRVMDAKVDRSFLTQIVNRLAQLAKPTREIDDRLIEPSKLCDIADAMMAEAEASHVQGRKSAVLFRDGLLIKLEALFPLRRGTVHKLQIGTHVLVEGEQVRLECGTDIVKEKREFGGMLPPDLARQVSRYIRIYRQRFLAGKSKDPGFLFLSWDGEQMFAGNLSRIVKDALTKRTGKKFSFHMFRHAAASFLAEHAPHQIGHARKLLHHRRISTTWKHYVRQTQRKSIMRYQDEVKRIVRSGKQRARSKKRR